MQYALPAQPTAEGSVIVAAAVPAKAILLSVDNTEADDVTERKFVANDPLTSKLELGVVVPIPIPVWLCKLCIVKTNKKQVIRVFIRVLIGYWNSLRN